MKSLHKLVVKDFNFPFYKKYEKLLLSKGWEYIDEGSARLGYRRGMTVIKIPKNRQGHVGNIVEAYAYRKYRNQPNDNGFVFAPCRLLPNVCLMMPFIQQASRQDLPEWSKWIDGDQCGYYNGRIVVYDSEVDVQHLQPEALRWAQLT